MGRPRKALKVFTAHHKCRDSSGAFVKVPGSNYEEEVFHTKVIASSWGRAAEAVESIPGYELLNLELLAQGVDLLYNKECLAEAIGLDTPEGM